MFLAINSKIVNSDSIDYIQCVDFQETGEIVVVSKNNFDVVSGDNAIEVLSLLYPSKLEGINQEYHWYSWGIHNLIGHPLMQIFTWLRMYKLASWFHDSTIPQPIIKKTR